MIKTGLIISCKCAKCGAIYMATVIWGGVPLDEDTTQEIAKAYKRGDEIKLTDNETIKMSMCKCDRKEDNNDD